MLSSDEKQGLHSIFVFNMVEELQQAPEESTLADHLH